MLEPTMAYKCKVKQGFHAIDEPLDPFPTSKTGFSIKNVVGIAKEVPVSWPEVAHKYESGFFVTNWGGSYTRLQYQTLKHFGSENV